jgi:hypothetical protein
VNELLLLIYLGDVADRVSHFLGAACAIGLVGSGAVAMYGFLERGKPLFTWVLPAAVACGLITTLIPTRHFFYIAAGGTAAVKALDSEIGQKVQLLINQKLDELVSVTPTKKKGSP